MNKKVGLFIAGNSKSGTSALCDYLGQHSAICLSTPKEPNYFATDFTHDHPEGAFRRLSVLEYQDTFAHNRDASVFVDGSACYLYSETAARNIADYNPEAKIVAIFREPVDFLHSYHLQMLRNVAAEGEVISSLEEALDAERDRRMGSRIPAGCRVPQMLYYRNRVKYAQQLSRFMRLFPRENIRVYIYDDFRSDNLRVVRDVYELAGVNSEFVPMRSEVNQGARTRAPRIARLLQDVSHGRGGYSAIHRVLRVGTPAVIRKRVLRALSGTLVADKGAILPEVRQSLMADFKDEVEALGVLIGRDLVQTWGYDNIRRET